MSGYMLDTNTWARPLLQTIPVNSKDFLVYTLRTGPIKQDIVLMDRICSAGTECSIIIRHCEESSTKQSPEIASFEDVITTSPECLRRTSPLGGRSDNNAGTHHGNPTKRILNRPFAQGAPVKSCSAGLARASISQGKQGRQAR